MARRRPGTTDTLAQAVGRDADGFGRVLALLQYHGAFQRVGEAKWEHD